MSGVTTLSRFTGLEEDKAAMRKTLIQITKLTPDENIESKIILSDILAAWDAARDYGKQELALKAAAVSNINLPSQCQRKIIKSWPLPIRRSTGRRLTQSFPASR